MRHIHADHYPFTFETLGCITRVLANSGTPVAGSGTATGNLVYAISNGSLTAQVVVSRVNYHVVTAFTGDGSGATSDWNGCLAI